MATKKICDVTGDEMIAGDVDYGGNQNNVIKFGDGLALHFGVTLNSQGNTHVSSEGLRQLLVKASEKVMVVEAVRAAAKSPKGAGVQVPETTSGTSAPASTPPAAPEGKVLTRK